MSGGVPYGSRILTFGVEFRGKIVVSVGFGKSVGGLALFDRGYYPIGDG